MASAPDQTVRSLGPTGGEGGDGQGQVEGQDAVSGGAMDGGEDAQEQRSASAAHGLVSGRDADSSTREVWEEGRVAAW